MATELNDDVLRLVFEDFTRGQPWKWPDAVYDQEEARRPFLLAAVSRRWRSLALDTATLWSYFGFPGNAKLYPKHSERLQVLLEASKNAPVDIIVTLGTPHDFNTDRVAEESHEAAEVLKALGSLGSRWRNVRFRLPSEATEHLRPALESPLPSLISLCAATGVEWNILPPAPRLEQLYSEIGWSALASPEASGSVPIWHYPVLSSFAVMGDLFAKVFCPQNFATLTTVCFNHDMRGAPAEPLQFPQVVSLTLDDARFLAHICAPRLIQLRVRGNSSFEFPKPLSGFETVESLVLYGNVRESLTTALWPLSGIQMIEFYVPDVVWTCFTRSTEWSISSSFFYSLNQDARGLTWPRLERIRFKRPRPHKTIGGSPEDLLDFVRERNTDFALSQRTARIAEIIVGKPGLFAPPIGVALAELTTISKEY